MSHQEMIEIEADEIEVEMVAIMVRFFFFFDAILRRDTRRSLLAGFLIFSL